MKTQEIEDMLEQGTDAMKVKRVFGEPIVHDGLTLIPVAKIRGAGGGGAGPDNAKGWGAGFGLTARPIGTYVIKGDDVRFVPAVDVQRIVLIVGAVAIAALAFVGRPLAKAFSKG